MLSRRNNYDIALRMLRYRILKALLHVFCSVFLLLVIAFFLFINKYILKIKYQYLILWFCDFINNAIH